MAETYCGKACVECAELIQSRCPGCRVGPGRQFGGTCKLADCVREKGHETCDTCSYRRSCGMQIGRDQMAELRAGEIAVQHARREAVGKAAPALAKWLSVMFWLFIPSAIAGVLSNDAVIQAVLGLRIPGFVLNTMSSVSHCVALLKLGGIENRYRIAGWCSLASFAVGSLVSLLIRTTPMPVWTLLITAPAAIVSLVGQYQMYMAHSAVLAGVYDDLSEGWKTLWKWNIGLYLAPFGCILIMVISPILGVILMLGAAVGLVVIGIMEMVYLYRTGKFFREYSCEQAVR